MLVFFRAAKCFYVWIVVFLILILCLIFNLFIFFVAFCSRTLLSVFNFALIKPHSKVLLRMLHSVLIKINSCFTSFIYLHTFPQNIYLNTCFFFCYFVNIFPPAFASHSHACKFHVAAPPLASVCNTSALVTVFWVAIVSLDPKRRHTKLSMQHYYFHS